jgi:hypothetical protein
VFATADREQRIDRWANHLCAHIDINQIKDLLYFRNN